MAVINLCGVMLREDSCFSLGTESLARLTQEAYNHPNISALVKVISSGGGQVNGTEHYASVLGASPKPVVTFVKDMMASAAYWVGSKAQHIMLESKTAMIGSIGTQFEMDDNTDYLASIGKRRVRVKATASSDKNAATEQALSGNYAPLREQMLDPLNDVFLSSVRAARPNVAEDALTGKMYVGQAAIDAGLADSFGTLQEAIALAKELADTSKVQQSKTDMNLFGKKFAALTALATASAITAEQLSAANAELEANGITGATLVSAEELTALNSENGELRTQLEAAQQELANSATAATDAANRISQLEADLQEAEQKIATYGSQPGATPTAPVADGNDLAEEKPNAERPADPEAEAISQFKIK